MPEPTGSIRKSSPTGNSSSAANPTTFRPSIKPSSNRSAKAQKPQPSLGSKRIALSLDTVLSDCPAQPNHIRRNKPRQPAQNRKLRAQHVSLSARSKNAPRCMFDEAHALVGQQAGDRSSRVG